MYSMQQREYGWISLKKLQTTIWHVIEFAQNHFLLLEQSRSEIVLEGQNYQVSLSRV